MVMVVVGVFTVVGGATVVAIVVGAAVVSVVVGAAVISVVTVGVGVTGAGLWVAQPANTTPAMIRTAKIRKILFFSMNEFSTSLLVTRNVLTLIGEL